MSTELVVTSISTEPKPMLGMQAQECPHCKANLIAQEIPADRRHLYLGFEKDSVTGSYKPAKDDGRFLFYSHLISMSSLLFDRTLAWKCPFCETVDVIPGMEQMWREELEYWAQREAQTIATGRAYAGYLPNPPARA